MIILTAEMKELKANPNKKARGAIIEAQLDKGRGPVATVLVQSGTLRVGDPVVAGPAYGRIRAMTDDKGRRVKSAGPSTPVEILGLSEVPAAGDSFYCLGHYTVIRRNNQNRDICNLRAAHTHCRKCLVTGCIQEGNGLAVNLNGVCTDMLCNAACFALCYAGMTDGIQQRGLDVYKRQNSDRGNGRRRSRSVRGRRVYEAKKSTSQKMYRLSGNEK